MSEFANEKIERILREGYEFRFGDYISQGFNIVQKNLGGYILYSLAVFVILFVVSFIPLVGSVLNQFILGPVLMVGAYLVAHKIQLGMSTEFGDFFTGFNFLGPLALASLAIFVLAGLSLVPFVFWGGGMELINWYMDVLDDPMAFQESTPDFSFSLTSFVLLLPAVYVIVAYKWAPMFVVFYKMNFWEAMEASRKIITRKWFLFLVFTILTSVIAGLGVLLLCVGLLFTYPAYLCMDYSAFADVTRLEDESKNADEIERHLI